MAEANAQDKARRKRSPSYPYINLKQAVDLAVVLYEAEGLNSMPASIAMQHMGYSPTGSSGIRVLATLVQFGLLEDEGKGGDKLVKLSDTAMSILEAPDEETRLDGIREAALRPSLHREIWDRWGLDKNELPSAATMRFVLLKDIGVHKSAVDFVIEEFRETYLFARLNERQGLARRRQVVTRDEDETPEVEPIMLPQPRQVPSGMKEHTIQLIGQPMARLILPHPITDRNLEHLIGWLRLMGPALTVPEGNYEEEDDEP